MLRQKNMSPEKLPGHEFRWSLRLLTLLQEMAAQKTNAVLQVLTDAEQVKTGQHYPEAGLLFADKHWRVFYHCHEATSMHPDEHGHFHIFTGMGGHDIADHEITNECWAHVAGLSIDAQGQPLQWFMVNRWVTDGPWLQRENFFRQLAYTDVSDEPDALVVNWLISLLQLYRGTLYELLEKRDAVIESHLKKQRRQEIFENRDIYTLATQPVNLQIILEKYLLPDHAEVPHKVLPNKNVRQNGRQGV